MKVGTDSVLLGAWTPTEKCTNILDIGSGTGILCLMLAQKSNAQITGIELDEDAFQESIENINSTDWKNRIQLKNQAVQHFSSGKKQEFDLIISNPPYFKNSLLSPSPNRSTARHNSTLDLNDLINAVLINLTPQGKFTCILPVEEGKELLKIAQGHQLFLSKICKVFTNVKQSKEKRWLMEFGFENSPTQAEQLHIENENRHDYTEAYKQLTKDFYLHF